MHVQDDVNPHIWHMREGAFSFDATHMVVYFLTMFCRCIVDMGLVQLSRNKNGNSNTSLHKTKGLSRKN